MVLSIGVLAATTGCGSSSDGVARLRERNGITYYLDGAGNWGFGVGDVPAGLKRAKYMGHVETYIWTTSFNPAIDQVSPLTKARASGLTDKIKAYLTKFPENDVNIIALSAGTGVATWAVERLEPPYKIKNLVLLGSSLSYNYNMSKALRNMKGMIYVYYSRYDSVLEGPVKALGTVDGKVGTDAIGLVGLRSPRGRERIRNYGWNRKYLRYGWSGSHTDCTSQQFVRAVLSRHIVPKAATTPLDADKPIQTRTRASMDGRTGDGWKGAARLLVSR